VAGGAAEHVGVTYVTHRSPNADYFEERWATFSATKDIHKEKGIKVNKRIIINYHRDITYLHKIFCHKGLLESKNRRIFEFRSHQRKCSITRMPKVEKEKLLFELGLVISVHVKKINMAIKIKFTINFHTQIRSTICS
jgi:hypothetical protein